MGKTKREGAWIHANGDVKTDPDTAPGINILPDGNVAMTKQFVEDAYEAIQGNERDDGDED